jgi:hypothetical protein
LVQEDKSNDAVTSLVTRKFKYFWDLYDVIIPFVKPLEDRCEGGIVAPFGTVGFEESPPIGNWNRRFSLYLQKPTETKGKG